MSLNRYILCTNLFQLQFPQNLFHHCYGNLFAPFMGIVFDIGVGGYYVCPTSRVFLSPARMELDIITNTILS